MPASALDVSGTVAHQKLFGLYLFATSRIATSSVPGTGNTPIVEVGKCSLAWLESALCIDFLQRPRLASCLRSFPAKGQNVKLLHQIGVL